MVTKCKGFRRFCTSSRQPFPCRITSGSLVTRQGSRAVREGSRNGHTAIGLAPRSSRFQKPEGVASKFARSARLRIATTVTRSHLHKQVVRYRRTGLPIGVLLRNATPSVLHQRHIGRVLRSSCNVRGRRLASSRSREPRPGRCPPLWPGDLRNDGGSVAAAGADGSKA